MGLGELLAGQGVPVDICQYVAIHGIPEGAMEGTIMERQEEGRCATCGGFLGEATFMIACRPGVVGLFCGGACLTDMQIMGWLQQQYEDHVTAIKFRGGAGDEPD